MRLPIIEAYFEQNSIIRKGMRLDCGCLYSCALLRTSASADTLYTYTGNEFTSFAQPTGYPQYFIGDYVSAWFVIEGPPLVCLTLCMVVPEPPCSTDFLGVSHCQEISVGMGGPNAFPGNENSQAAAEMQTDASGNIVAWVVTACLKDAPPPMCEDARVGTWNEPGIVIDQTILGNAQAWITDDPGTWTILRCPSRRLWLLSPPV